MEPELFQEHYTEGWTTEDIEAMEADKEWQEHCQELLAEMEGAE